MPWQGQPGIMIDRFDVRAHLDMIPSRPKKEDSDSSEGSGEEVWEDRQAKYERYRILVQNEFIGGKSINSNFLTWAYIMYKRQSIIHTHTHNVH